MIQTTDAGFRLHELDIRIAQHEGYTVQRSPVGWGGYVLFQPGGKMYTPRHDKSAAWLDVPRYTTDANHALSLVSDVFSDVVLKRYFDRTGDECWSATATVFDSESGEALEFEANAATLELVLCALYLGATEGSDQSG